MVNIHGIANPWAMSRSGSGASLRIIDSAGNGQAVLNKALARIPPQGDGEAHFHFGGPSSFTLTQPDQQTNPGATVTWPPDDSNKDDEPKEIHIIEYDEVFRSTEKIRVQNPDDPEQYVMVKSTLRIVFQGRDDGLYRGFNFKSAKEQDR